MAVEQYGRRLLGDVEEENLAAVGGFLELISHSNSTITFPSIGSLAILTTLQSIKHLTLGSS